MNWFKNLFNKFFPIFRDGMEKFLVDNLQKSIEIAETVVKNYLASGTKFDGTQLAHAIYLALKEVYPNSFDTWLRLLANYAIDALKKAGTLA